MDNACFYENLNNDSLISLESLGLFKVIYIDSSMIKSVKNGVYINIVINLGEFKIFKTGDEEY